MKLLKNSHGNPSTRLGVKGLAHSATAKGFTLIEVMIALGLLAVAGAMTVLMGVDSVARSVAIGERDTAVTLLETARTEALANIDEMAHGVHIGSTEYVVFTTASDYASRDQTKDNPYPRETAVTISGPTDVIFSQLSGGVGAGVGTLTFADGAQSTTIGINAEGRIDW
ncbi:MAG: prepilin-type N-terminal cleavage/methylation domain-containing protein [Patescibacteria group bacterium]